MKFLSDETKLIFHFPKDKIQKADRELLAYNLRELLGVKATLVCDCDCEIYAIQPEAQEQLETQPESSEQNDLAEQFGKEAENG